MGFMERAALRNLHSVFLSSRLRVVSNDAGGAPGKSAARVAPCKDAIASIELVNDHKPVLRTLQSDFWDFLRLSRAS